MIIYKTCKNCLETKDVALFAKCGKTPNGAQKIRDACKKCHSERVWSMAKDKKIEQNPALYFQCDDCGFSWHKIRKHQCCPKCESKNFFKGE